MQPLPQVAEALALSALVCDNRRGNLLRTDRADEPPPCLPAFACSRHRPGDRYLDAVVAHGDYASERSEDSAGHDAGRSRGNSWRTGPRRIDGTAGCRTVGR